MATGDRPVTNWADTQTRAQILRDESAQWNISLSERFELEALARSNLKPVNKFEDDDWVDLEFRSIVAEVLTERGLMKKAERFLLCSRQAILLRCKGDLAHEFFSPHYCDLRFCSVCGPRQFRRLYAKHSGVLTFISRRSRRGFRLRLITLTSRNTGSLAYEDIKRFNAQVKATLLRLLGGVTGWGALAVLEVGFNNFNLHAHILAYCPYIEQRELARVWNEISGHEVVWINQTRVAGPRALCYLLKYVSKAPSDNPEHIGQLEAAFHKTRRVHAYGIFYNFTHGDPDGEQSHWLDCALCGAKLERIGKLRYVYEFQREGLKFIGDFPRERKNTKWIN